MTEVNDPQLEIELNIAYLDREREIWLGNKASRLFVAARDNEIRMDRILLDLFDLGYGVDYGTQAGA